MIKNFVKTICVLDSYQPLILFHLQLAVRSFCTKLNSILSPLAELGLAHFLFHEASVVLLVGAIVYLPHRIVLYLLLEVVTHSVVAAGLGRVTAYESFAVVRERGVLHDEPPTAVAALDRHKLLLNALEQLKIQKGSQRCETVRFTEYGTLFRLDNCVSHAHTSA